MATTINLAESTGFTDPKKLKLTGRKSPPHVIVPGCSPPLENGVNRFLTFSLNLGILYCLAEKLFIAAKVEEEI